MVTTVEGVFREGRIELHAELPAMNRLQAASMMRHTASKVTSAVKPIHVAIVLLLVVVQCRRSPPSPSASPSHSRPAQTMANIRNVATAMMAWQLDNRPEDLSETQDGQERLDWSRCPPISHPDLVRLLVPDYIREVPARDAWGNRLEFCLRTSGSPATSYVLGVRSAGPDGAFEGATYSPGPFPALQLQYDIVWLDGYFMRWPE